MLKNYPHDECKENNVMRYTQKPYAHVVEAFQEYLAKLGNRNQML